jgi:pSer/pThr/pTyr-binding forkhead associated (FHA) protein
MKISLLSLDPNHSIHITDCNHSSNITRVIKDPITPVVVCRVRDPNQISENNLFFLEKIISRKHAIIYEQDNQIYVKDTKSSGGTWVNGKRLSNAEVESSPMRLSEDDIIQFGEDTEFDGSNYF